MKKTILQGVFFSILAHVLVFGFQVMRGYLLTKDYVPSISESYDNVHMLQNEVAFGVVYNTNGLLLFVFTFVVVVFLYMGGKLIWLKAVAK